MMVRRRDVVQSDSSSAIALSDLVRLVSGDGGDVSAEDIVRYSHLENVNSFDTGQMATTSMGESDNSTVSALGMP